MAAWLRNGDFSVGMAVGLLFHCLWTTCLEEYPWTIEVIGWMAAHSTAPMFDVRAPSSGLSVSDGISSPGVLYWSWSCYSKVEWFISKLTCRIQNDISCFILVIREMGHTSFSYWMMVYLPNSFRFPYIFLLTFVCRFKDVKYTFLSFQCLISTGYYAAGQRTLRRVAAATLCRQVIKAT